MKTIALITCYHDPDYVRSRSLSAALRTLPGVKVIEIKNTTRGIRKYPEVIWKTWQLKRTGKVDAFLLTFRGHEILPFIRLISGRTPLWFDEFVPPAHNLSEPYKRSWKKTMHKLVTHLFLPVYYMVLRRLPVILADTHAHAELSARLAHVNLSRYLALPVGVDETKFKMKNTPKATPFQIFYYSTGMQPLHGVAHVLEAAVMLQHDPVQFLLVGGHAAMRRAVAAAQQEGANIIHRTEWVPTAEMADLMRASSVSLGGPFGVTRQADHVVTGKTYQSLACGVPTILGATKASEELFIDRKNCLKVPLGDARALAETVRWAVAHEKELQEIGQAGHALYEKRFTPTALGRLLSPLIDSL